MLFYMRKFNINYNINNTKNNIIMIILRKDA
jgi:hypothetical protein